MLMQRLLREMRNSKFCVLAVMVTTRGALDVARAGALLGKRGISSNFSEILQNPNAPFSSFKEHWMENVIDFEGMKSTLDSNAKQITDCFERVRGSFNPWDRGTTNTRFLLTNLKLILTLLFPN